MKKVILGFIIGIVVCGVVGVSAITLLAKDIAYKDTNVESALNDLYNKADKEILHNLALKMRTQALSSQYPSTTNYMIFLTKLRQFYSYFKITDVSCNNYVNQNNNGIITYGDRSGNYDVLSPNVEYSFEVYSNILTDVISSSNGNAAYCDVTINFYN